MEKTEIVKIPADQIYMHPDNPRKSLGDISELSASIKKNGIMQNLTVIEGHWDNDKNWHTDGFTLLIGHRRFAAGKQAGVTDFPCKIIGETDKKTQLGIMLEENMQRNDLTIWEQANGFQMMLDLGDTEDQIAEKTGFCKATIRHRLNIAKLDSEVLQEKERQEGYQLSLTDLYELEKIKDIKTRDNILKASTDSKDLMRRALFAQSEQKSKENLKCYIASLKKMGIKKAPNDADREFNTDKWERVISYDLRKEPPAKIKIKENGEQIFYIEKYGYLYLIRKAKKGKKVLSPQKEENRQKARNKKQLHIILRGATNTRKVFIEGILSGKIKVKETKELEADLFSQMLSYEGVTGNITIKRFFFSRDLYAIPKEEMETVEKKIDNMSLLHKLLCLISVLIGESEFVSWDNSYKENVGEKAKKFYDVLAQYGFQFANDEEKSAIEGTNDLYNKENK